MNIKSAVIVALWGGLVAALAVWMVAPKPAPRPRLHDSSFRITDDTGTLVTPERNFELPFRVGDFDLNCHVVLSAGAELDLVFRKVEHWGDVPLPLFHARFTVLRMSSQVAGPGFLSREQALFETPPAGESGGRPAGTTGGILIESGEPGASLRVECRGRVVRANVNGIDLGPLTLADDFGNTALVVRHGTARLHEFHLTPWPSKPAAPAWLPAAAIGVTAALLLVWLGAPFMQLLLALSLALLGGVVGRIAGLDQLLLAVQADPDAVLAAALCCLPLAFLCGLPIKSLARRAMVGVVVGGIGCFALLETAVRIEFDRFAALEDDRMELFFGPESGTAPFDAISRMLRCEFVAHTLLPHRYDVLLLGGKQFFDYREPGHIEKNVGASLSGRLSARLELPRRRRAEVAAVPTELSHVYQQFLLFKYFYRDYRPRVVVLGITEAEAGEFLHPPGRVVSQRLVGYASALLAVRGRMNRERSARQSPHDLQTTLGKLALLCRAVDAQLVLVTDAGVPLEFLTAVREFAEKESTPIVEGFDLDSGTYPVDALVDVIARMLPR